MKRIYTIVLVAFCLFSGLNTFAQTTPHISEAEVEQRARSVGKSLRCVVCQNQSIDDSNAPLAADMRLLVRERIRAGDRNEDVLIYMRDRYGDFVLLKPPFQPNTYILWFAPMGLLVLFLLWYIVQTRRPKQSVKIAQLSDDEQKRYDALITKIEPKS
ncbi:MAG: cytochrome C biogenesis protein [Robiginitomaculum sp.]|nr:MAG: cytochrome C biogenesis protein [Robiginitomaculum sp.]